MSVLRFLSDLGANAEPGAASFHAQPLYVLVCVGMPVLVGLVVGFGLRAVERIFGIQLGRGGH